MQKYNLIGQGTYGCVYLPNIPCLNENPKNKSTQKQYISKIQRIDENSEREEILGKIIKTKIKQYNTMFAPVIDSCPININAIPKSELDKCEPIAKDKVSELNSEYKSYKMRYAGNKSIGNYFLSLLNKNPKKLLKRIIEIHLYLLKSLNKLIKLDIPIIHYDLKDNNIIYNDDLDVPIIIDFGLSFELEPEKNYDYAIASKQYYVYYNPYPPWCIELVLLSYIVQEILYNKDNSSKIEDVDINNLKDICTTFISDNNVFIKCFTKEETENFKLELHNFVSSYSNKTWKTLFQDLQKGYATWDHYSIAVIFLLFFNDILKELTNQQSQIIDNYIFILKKIILNSPVSPRQSIDETIQLIKKMAKSINKTQYHNLLDNIKSNVSPKIINQISINVNKNVLMNEKQDNTVSKKK